MKKLLSICLTVALLLCFSCSMAEEVLVQQSPAAFEVTMVIPEGYKMTEERIGDMLFIDVLPEKEDASACLYNVSIAFSEEYEGRSMADLSQEEKDALILSFKEAYENATLSEMTTKEGTQVFILDENDSESDYAMAFTIYKSYFIQVYFNTPNFDVLTAENLAMVNDILSNMQLVDKK